MPQVAVVTSDRFVAHETGPAHPERPDRLRAVHAALIASGLLAPGPGLHAESPFEFGPTLRLGLAPIERITPEPADESAVLLAHSPALLDHVRRGCAAGAVLDGADTPTCPASFNTALLALGATLHAVARVITGPARTRAFCAVRPPGHHAEFDRPMGFCLFNHVAVAARYLQQQFSVDRIAVVDFDVHHGNGTQHIFEADPRVFFASIHQHPATLYPGTGHAHETGTGAGRGFTLNVPVDPGADDATYEKRFDDQLLPALDRYRPQVLLISAGFDAHALDPLAQVCLSDDAYETMTSKLMSLADTHCEGKALSLLEGGYHLPALGRSVVRHVSALCD
jgi:acetoin utilization deacetylase AcuC-like enzyme